MASASYTISTVKHQYACSTEITLTEAPGVQMSRVTIIPDTVLATWGRDTKSNAWYLVALSVSGPRKVADEIRPDDRRVMRFQKVDDAPSWVRAAAKTNTPAR